MPLTLTEERKQTMNWGSKLVARPPPLGAREGLRQNRQRQSGEVDRAAWDFDSE